MKRRCFRGGSVFAGDSFEQRDLYVDAGLICARGCAEYEVIDCSGLYILPSCIDLGVPPMDSILTADGIISLAGRALRGGVSTIFLNPPFTSVDKLHSSPCLPRSMTFGPDSDLSPNVCGALPINVLPMVSGTTDQGRLNDVDTLHSHYGAKVIAARSDSEVLLQIMRYVRMLDSVLYVSVHHESGVAYESRFARNLGLPLMSEISQIVEVARIKEMSKFLGISTIVSSLNIPYCVEMLQDCVCTYAQIPLPHLLLDESKIADYDTRFKISPPLLPSDQRRALLNTLPLQGKSFLSSMESSVSDHRKARDFQSSASGFDGLEHYFSVCYTMLVMTGIISMSHLIDLTSRNMASLLGLNKGRLSEGYDADFMLVDLDSKRIIDQGPYSGMEVRGHIKSMVVGGEVIHVHS